MKTQKPFDSTVNALKGTRILCVDDSWESLALLRLILNRLGVLVTTCSTAEDAIGLLGKECFDVVVSDLSMPPGLDGYDLVHALRRMEDQDPDRRTTPAIAVSGDAMMSSKKRRYADFQVYMPKPADKTRLVYLLERLIEADGEAVTRGSLGSWEAEEATAAAVIATNVAADATAAAAEATIEAADATDAAANATMAATNARVAALGAEKNAKAASSSAP